MCRVTPAANANDCRRWGTISVDTACQPSPPQQGSSLQSPIFSRVNGRWQMKKGRDEMSITARASAWVINSARPRVTYLIQWGVGVTVSLDPLAFSQGLLECLTKGKSAILGSVMVVNPQISFAVKGQRHSAVLRESCEHLQGQINVPAHTCDLHGPGTRYRSAHR